MFVLFSRKFAISALAGMAMSALVVPNATAETVLGTLDVVVPEAPNAHVMSFLVSANPGEAFPMHSHGGSGGVLLLKGTVEVEWLDGRKQNLKAGDTFQEAAGEVHGAKVTSSEPAEFIWTIVLPDGAELETPYEG